MSKARSKAKSPPNKTKKQPKPTPRATKPKPQPKLAKPAPQPPKPPPTPPALKADVLVLGQHPAAYLCAALLANKSKLRVLHATIPEEPAPDRLALINQEIYDLHQLIAPLRRKLDCTSVYGTAFLADHANTRTEYHSKSAMAVIALYADVRSGMKRLAHAEGVEFVTPGPVNVRRIDEGGLDVWLGPTQVRPKVLVLAGPVSPQQEKLLGMPESWDHEVLHRYTFIKFKPPRGSLDLGSRPIVPMSLDLMGKLCWGWLLCHHQEVQLAVEQPIEILDQVRPADLLAHWVQVLKRHNVLRPETQIPLDEAHSLDMPLAGALAHEGLANRTLLIGPAGGFYSASGEDLYPNVWSALFAADAIKKAFKEPHVQDALQPYRQKWRTTLGDYLRGPQQNLRFLLPLVYRNQVMTTRLAEAILQGKQMVR